MPPGYREAPLQRVGSGLAPAGEGWFVVNVADAAWLRNDAFGGRCVFEADVPVVRGTEHEPVRFGQLGMTLAVLEPGKPSGLYHAETVQEGFLVLRGECVLQVEDTERPLRAWDFVHCPPGTAHGFVGAGDGPCVLLMVGARVPGKAIEYPREGTGSAREAYAGYPHWENGRPEGLPFP
jgi:quercetin dioxygenase-like cupin family protein